MYIKLETDWELYVLLKEYLHYNTLRISEKSECQSV